jgi:hypothetical protein
MIFTHVLVAGLGAERVACASAGEVRRHGHWRRPLQASKVVLQGQPCITVSLRQDRELTVVCDVYEVTLVY